MKYHVIGLIDATKTVEVEAATPEAALEAAYDDMHVSVCYQCAREIEVGEVYACRVIDDDGAGEEVYSDEPPNLHLATIEQLEAELVERCPNLDLNRAKEPERANLHLATDKALEAELARRQKVRTAARKRAIRDE